MRTLKHRCEPSAARDGLLRFAQPMATLRSPSPQRPSGSTIWIFWEHSDEMTGNILARQWHPRLGTSTDEAIRVPSRLSRSHPVSSWPMAKAEQRSPLAPAPLQDLQRYYGLLRPCPACRYSRPRDWRRLWLVPSRRPEGERCDAGQVLTFHTKAWSSFAPPTCPDAARAVSGIPRADPGGRVIPRF